MSEEVTSRLWKAVQLANSSAYFPGLVQAAALYNGKRYSEALKWAVATNTNLLDALHLRRGESVDILIEDLITTNGVDVDTLINAAVVAYVEPKDLGAGQTPPGKVV